jgi:hypothetical protein
VDFFNIRDLKAKGSNCGGARMFKGCPYKKANRWDNGKIPKGTTMLELYGDYRYCPDCSVKLLSLIEKEIAECRVIITDSKEEEVTYSRVSLLRED